MTEYFVKTETGSIYVLNREKMSWRRAAASKHPVRTDDGQLVEWPIMNVGQPLVLLGPPIAQDADLRVIRTSNITEVQIVAS